jgi:hypothetical protein
MGALTLNSQKLAQLKSFGKRGNIEASIVSAMLDGVKVLELSAGAEAVNVIQVTGQLKDWDGSNIAVATDVKVRSTPVAGAGTAAVDTGTAVAGDGTTELWLKTDATGLFVIDVTNASAEENMLEFVVDDGVAEVLILTFA